MKASEVGVSETELPRKKKMKKNNTVTVAYSSSAPSCFDTNVAASSLHTDEVVRLYSSVYFTHALAEISCVKFLHTH